ncbi:hypothetical protein DFH07DRAFT_391187 [Mycena maculata]|uniref:Uncharacterized protein n=1 Tax=Mycena maculata TaxID=230809 RepID=A0AAD7NZY9_9AGAR|nr:hypothetical protein DFH07DRAFT_391187 [Mycena maculata]
MESPGNGLDRFYIMLAIRKMCSVHPPLPMPTVGEVSLELLQSAPPTSTTSTMFGTLLIFALTAWLSRCISPTRLTAVLLAVLHETEEAHFTALEGGVLSGSDPYTKKLLNLQMKVSITREASLLNSLSTYQFFLALLKGRSLILLQCIREVQGLKTEIEILKEKHLQNLGARGAGISTRTMAIRRRHSTTFNRGRSI